MRTNKKTLSFLAALTAGIMLGSAGVEGLPVHAEETHNYVRTEVVTHEAATCAIGGYDLWQLECTDDGCDAIAWGAIYSEDEPALGHDFSSEDGTCTRCGLTAEEVADMVYAAPEDVSGIALKDDTQKDDTQGDTCEHKWEEVETWEDPADCVTYSEKWASYKCSVCGETKKEMIEQGNTYTDHKFDENGVCTCCGQTKAELGIVDNTPAATTEAPATTATQNTTTAATSTTAAASVTTATTNQTVTVSTPALKTVKNKKGKKLYVKWTKVKGASGYQVQYAKNSKFKKATTKTLSKKSTSLTKKLSKKTYYVRVRAFKKVNGKKVYSAWTKVKKVKIKK